MILLNCLKLIINFLIPKMIMITNHDNLPLSTYMSLFLILIIFLNVKKMSILKYRVLYSKVKDKNLFAFGQDFTLQFHLLKTKT